MAISRSATHRRLRGGAAALAVCLGAAVAPAQTLPSLPTGPADDLLSAQQSFVLTAVRFAGNTRFTAEQLLDTPLDVGVPGGKPDPAAGKVRDLLGKPVAIEKLEQVRVAVTLRYVNAGFINSGAVLDDQPVKNGVVVVRVVEGMLTDINVTGTRWLRPYYVRSRVAHAAGPPLDVNRLSEQLELLRQDRNVERINAELRPGANPGESTIDVKVAERNTFELGTIFDNHRPPSVGAERLSAYVATGDLLGFGDSFRGQVALTEGGFDDFNVIGRSRGGDAFSRLPEAFITYTVPVSPSDTTVTFNYTKTDSDVVEQAFAALNIRSNLEAYALTLRQPVYRTPSSEAAVFVTGDVRRNETFLLGEHFSFSPGAQDGQSNTTALRVGQEFTSRDAGQALALRSTFSFGVDAFGPTQNGGTTADSQFWSWIGQAQYVRKLNAANWQGVARVAAQFTDQPLLVTEQFSVGGVDTVRGYRENTFVRDNGVAASLELHVPLYTNATRGIDIQAVPFFDIGYAYDHNGNPSYDVIESVGVGLTADYTKYFSAQVFYGQRLNDVDHQTDDLQDIGIHFQIVVRAF